MSTQILHGDSIHIATSLMTFKNKLAERISSAFEVTFSMRVTRGKHDECRVTVMYVEKDGDDHPTIKHEDGHDFDTMARKLLMQFPEPEHYHPQDVGDIKGVQPKRFASRKRRQVPKKLRK